MNRKDNVLDEAICFATLKHKGQLRLDGSPFICHLLETSVFLQKNRFDETYQTVAILHDVLEKTDTSIKEIEVFGDDIVSAVKLLTRQEGQSEEEYIKNILTNKYATYVKVASIANNLVLIKNLPTKNDVVKSYYNKLKQYYRKRFCMALDYMINSTYNSFNHLLTEYSSYIITFTPEYFKMYSDIEKEREINIKERYNKGLLINFDVKDIVNIDAWEDEVRKYIAFDIDYKNGIQRHFELDENGWYEYNKSIFDFSGDVIMDDLSRVSKKSCIHFVDMLKKSNKFLSHVDIDNIYKILNSFPEERFTYQYTPEFREMTHDEILELINKFQKRAADSISR